VPLVVRDDVRSCVNVCSRPDDSAPAFTCLSAGTRVDAVDVAPYWRQVRLADRRIGWAAKKFLETPTLPAPLAPSDREDAWLEVHVVDVGQGDGIWIHTFDDNVPGNGRYEGKNIVIDGGPDGSDAKNPLLKYLAGHAHEGAIVDALIITHPHDDHYPGATGILRHFDVREYYDPGYPKTGARWAAFRTLVDAERVQGHPIVEHIGRDNFGTPDWGGELRVRWLYAYPGSPAGLGHGNTLENNASIVFKLEYGSQSILFMGDAEGKDRDDPPAAAKYVERWLLNALTSNTLKATVLKIAHHGSETSSSVPFIAAVDPAFVVVSSGRKSFNGAHLPDASTLHRYCVHNPATRIYRTDQDDEIEGRTAGNDADGDHVIIRTNGRVTTVEAYSAGRRITQTACVP
jgi:competence protein ComEC